MADGQPNEYGDLGKAELQDLCRGRGLPVSGTKEELIARLVEADDQGKVDTATDDTGAEQQPAAETSPAAGQPDQADNQDIQLGGLNPDGLIGRTRYRVSFPHQGGPGAMTDDLHFTFLERAHAAAGAAGLVSRGGAHTGTRVGYGTDAAGGGTVTYEISVRSADTGARYAGTRR